MSAATLIFTMKLSIITVSWRDPEGLNLTINSLRHLPQSSVDFEHIVVSDTKPTVAPQWPLRWLEETEPRGIYPAMNRGREAARGEAFWFLNGGDALRAPSVLERCLEPLWSMDGVWAGARIWERGKPRYTHQSQEFSTAIENGVFPCHQGFIYHRRAFRVGGFPEELAIAADEVHFLKMWRQRLPIVALPETLVDYDGGGRSQTRWAHRFQELTHWYQEHVPDNHPLQWHLKRRLWKAWAGDKVRRVPALRLMRPLWWRFLDRRGGYA